MTSPIGMPLGATALAISAPELGMSDSEASVQAGIRRMRPGSVLAGVAFLLAGAEGRGNPNGQWSFVHHLYQGTPLATRLHELEQASGLRRTLIVPRPLLRVAQSAVLNAKTNNIVTPASLSKVDLQTIVKWSLVLAEHHRETAERQRPAEMGTDDVALELARFHWLSQPPSIGDVDRTHSVLLNHLSPLARERVDLALEDAYGVTLEELWNALVINWLRASIGNGTIPPISGPWPTGAMDKTRLQLAGRSIRQDVAELRASVQIDSDTSTLWGYTAFRNRPVTRTTNGVDLAVRPAFVGEKATLTGMFHLIGSAYRQKYGASQYGFFAGEVGMAVDRRCRELITDATVGRARAIWEDELSSTVTAGSKKVCDALWILDRRWVAMDFVHRQPSLAAQATGGIDDLARELRLSVVDKLHQVDETLERMLSETWRARYGRPNEILPVIVNGAGSPIMGAVERVMLESFKAETWRVFGRDPRVLDPAVIGLDDLERAAALASTGKANLGSLLVQWRRSDSKTASFSYWLWSQRDRGAIPSVPIRESPSRDLIVDVNGDL